MPEGPSIVILKEETEQFSGQKVISSSGNSAIDMERLEGKTILSFRTWGKHFLICFENFTVKIHLLMFGTYLINEAKKNTIPRLHLGFSNGEINFYTCSVKILEGDINTFYNWSEDVMNENWNPKQAKESLSKISKEMICDALLNQNIFSGVGNIIKNEVLYRAKIHPESLVGKIPPKSIKKIIEECVAYSFEFLYRKKKFELKKYWLVYTKKNCERCNLPIIKKNNRQEKPKKFLLYQLSKIIRMKKNIFIGYSSFNNRYWKGIFYPEDLPVSKWFDFYCQHFDTYEMNGTFYKFPTQKFLENWYAKVPENFLFSVKVPKEITHVKKFNDCELILKDFYKVCQMGLKEKLGCILFQFPPSYEFTSEKLQNIMDKLDLNFKNVIEFRHKSWWNQEVWDVFLKHSITFCSVSYPGLPDTIFINFPIIYIRLHGQDKLFYSNYSAEQLLLIKDAVSAENQADQVFIYFNNTASTAGILNALKLKALFTKT